MNFVGVTSLVVMEGDKLLIGAGDGTVELVKQLQPPGKKIGTSQHELKSPSLPMLSVVSSPFGIFIKFIFKSLILGSTLAYTSPRSFIQIHLLHTTL